MSSIAPCFISVGDIIAAVDGRGSLYGSVGASSHAAAEAMVHQSAGRSQRPLGLGFLSRRIFRTCLVLKTSLLLALCTAKRVSDLCTLSTRKDCLSISGDGMRAVLWSNPAFTPQVISCGFRGQTCVLPAFSPPPHLSVGDERLHRLCPVRSLARYVSASERVRRAPQLFVCYGGRTVGLPLSS